jgi:hypothetical protein
MHARSQISSLLILLTFMVSCLAQETSVDNQLTSREKAEGWILLFDGETYQGWMTSDQTPSRRDRRWGHQPTSVRRLHDGP